MVSAIKKAQERDAEAIEKGLTPLGSTDFVLLPCLPESFPNGTPKAPTFRLQPIQPQPNLHEIQQPKLLVELVNFRMKEGVPIDKVAALNQKTRDYVGKKLLELTLMELFVFRFMQTDPNWSNFLFDEATNVINLIDFGAARGYTKKFVDDYLRMVVACSNCDRDAVIEMSTRLGFLTGTEEEIMLDAHFQAGFVVGLPFSKPGGYDFRSTNITQSLSNLGARMLRHRLTPPPDEVYSLHRKLSGAFLACIKLGAVVPCRDLLYEVHEQYQFGDEGNELLQQSSSMS